MRKVFTIETIEPLVLRSDTSLRSYTSLNYIPGTVIKGAFANRYIAKYGIDNRFKELFLEGNVLFKNFYPISSRYRENVILTNPFPETAYSCKRWPGFNFDSTDTRQTHGVYDLIFLKAFSIVTPKCPKCGEPLKPMSGFYNLMKDNTKYASSEIEESKTIFTHTAIYYSTGVAKTGQLYNEEAIVEGQYFRGEIIDGGKYIPFLSDFLKESGYVLRLGRGRTRGYGKIKVLDKDFPRKDISFEGFKERIARFNELALRFGGNKDKFYFAVDLISDAIVLDNYLRYKKFIDSKYISSLLGNIECKEIYSASSTREVIGWNVSWNLPKVKHIAIKKGSVFLFEVPKSKEGILTKYLFDLENKGLGIIRDEGFGFISISDKFHLDNYFKEEKNE